MKIVALGDSLTYGFGVYKSECWLELTKNTLNIEILNKGINGDTTSGMLSRSYRDAIEINPNYVIIMGGTNDLFKNTPPKNIKENILELIKEAESFNIIPIVGIQIPVYAPMAMEMWSPYIDYTKVNIDIEEYHSFMVNHCMENNILFIDFYKNFSGSLNSNNINSYYVDGVHPSALGHKLMANSLINLLGEYI